MNCTGTKWVELNLSPPDKAWKPELMNHWQPLPKGDDRMWRKFVTQVGEDAFHWECGIGDVHKTAILVTDGVESWVEHDALRYDAEQLFYERWMPIPPLPPVTREDTR